MQCALSGEYDEYDIGTTALSNKVNYVNIDHNVL